MACPDHADRALRPAAGRLQPRRTLQRRQRARPCRAARVRGQSRFGHTRQREGPRLPDRDPPALRVRCPRAGDRCRVARGRRDDARGQHHRGQAGGAARRRGPRVALRLGRVGPGRRGRRPRDGRRARGRARAGGASVATLLADAAHHRRRGARVDGGPGADGGPRGPGPPQDVRQPRGDRHRQSVRPVRDRPGHEPGPARVGVGVPAPRRLVHAIDLRRAAQRHGLLGAEDAPRCLRHQLRGDWRRLHVSHRSRPRRSRHPARAGPGGARRARRGRRARRARLPRAGPGSVDVRLAAGSQGVGVVAARWRLRRLARRRARLAVVGRHGSPCAPQRWRAQRGGHDAVGAHRVSSGTRRAGGRGVARALGTRRGASLVRLALAAVRLHDGDGDHGELDHATPGRRPAIWPQARRHAVRRLVRRAAGVGGPARRGAAVCTRGLVPRVAPASGRGAARDARAGVRRHGQVRLRQGSGGRVGEPPLPADAHVAGTCRKRRRGTARVGAVGAGRGGTAALRRHASRADAGRDAHVGVPGGVLPCRHPPVATGPRRARGARALARGARRGRQRAHAGAGRDGPPRLDGSGVHRRASAAAVGVVPG